MAYIRTLMVWLTGIPFTLFLFPFVILFSITDRTGSAIHYIGRHWMSLGLFLGGVKITVVGVENIPKGPKILMANHLGSFDILALQGRVPVQFRWVAKKSLFSIPVIGWSMAMAGYIAIDRSSARKAVESIDIAVDKIKKGLSILIFPEGERNQTKELLLPFKKGGFVFAEKSGVPIVPIALSGTRDIAVKGSILIHPTHAIVHIGEPIDSKGKDTKQLMEETEKALTKLLKEDLGHSNE